MKIKIIKTIDSCIDDVDKLIKESNHPHNDLIEKSKSMTVLSMFVSENYIYEFLELIQKQCIESGLLKKYYDLKIERDMIRFNKDKSSEKFMLWVEMLNEINENIDLILQQEISDLDILKQIRQIKR